MAGFDAPYVPGWDCHGLPIEIKVDAELGSRKAKMTASEIRAECRKYAQKYVELHRREFKRLGVFGEWENPYLTMSADYEAVIAQAFVDFLDQGLRLQGPQAGALVHALPHGAGRGRGRVREPRQPVDLGAVRADLRSGEDRPRPGRAAASGASSGPPRPGPSRPTWPSPSTPSSSTWRWRCAGDVYIVAAGPAEGHGGEVRLARSARSWRASPATALEGAVFRHPFLERDSVGILADHVTLEQGTGAVHTAPGHGQEDYVIGQQYGIATYCPVDAAGRFYHAEGAAGRLPEEIIGKTVWDANPIVVGILRRARRAAGRGPAGSQLPALLALPQADHLPRHRAVVHRHGAATICARSALEAIQKVKWMPGWGEERISNMIGTRPDWCISRQRVWGVPIVVFYCDECGEALTDRKCLDRVVELFREHTADVWYEKTEAELLGPEARCAKCGGGTFRKGSDILDVWFDSGSSHLAVLNETVRPALALRPVRRGRRTSIAAGSTVRCWWASG